MHALTNKRNDPKVSLSIYPSWPDRFIGTRFFVLRAISTSFCELNCSTDVHKAPRYMKRVFAEFDIS